MVYICTNINFYNKIVFAGQGITLGRDFSGTIVDVGMTACSEYKIGDEVWGATFPSSQGSHADFVTASTYTIAKVCDRD